MELTNKLLSELQNRLKVGSRRGVHLNAIPANSQYKFDLSRLSYINKNLPGEFINSLLTEQPLKFKISWKENVADLNTLVEAEQVQLVKITKSFENLINQTETIESEKGINTFGFGFPLLIRRDQSDNKLTVAPILIWSLRIKRTNEFNTWVINRNEDDPIYINELLINHLQNDTKVLIDQISSELLDDGLIDKKDLIDICVEMYSAINATIPEGLPELFGQKLNNIKAIPDKKHYEKLLENSNNSIIDFCGLFSIFEVQKQNIITEYNDLINSKEVSIDLADMEKQLFQPISSVETDPSQQSILHSMETIRNILIQGPPGTGKSQSLTAILINALENHKRTIVVCEKNTALEVLHNSLKERGLGDCCALIKDIVKDRKNVVSSVRERIDGSSYKSIQYEYSKLSLGNSLLKTSSLIESINRKHKNVGEKIFGDSNWTKLVGQLLSELKNYDEEIDLSLNHCHFRFETKELNELVSIVEKGQILYDRYAPNESKSFLNSSKLIGNNSYFLEQKIKMDFEEYMSEFDGESSLIKKYSTEYQGDNQFFNLRATKKLSFRISALFSRSKRKKLKDQKNVYKLCLQLLDRIEKDNWIEKPSRGQNIQIIINQIQSLLKVNDDYFKDEDDIFENEFNWFQFYNDNSDDNKILIERLKGKKDWRKVLVTSYLNLVLIKNSNKDLPSNDEEIHEFDKSLSNIGKQQIKYIKDYWFSRQMEAARYFYQNNLNLSVENLYNKRSSFKYKRLSLRQIVKYDSKLFTTFYPIILTTPDVCSNLFRGMNGHFDIVLFDEASQLRLEDNLPALLKGKQIIIAGDEHQMPPSNYFSKIFDGTIEDEEDVEEEEDEIIIDRDNILLSCESLLDFGEELSFEKRYLDFHYRSKHPYLIDFSNHAFYNCRLQPLPHNLEYVPIKYIQVNGTFSDHCNEREADAVLSVIENNIHRLPSGMYPSVGIATFNIAHRNLIQSKILERKKFEKYEEFNQKINELEENGLFIKNLENIQGDERDVIILSTTYGMNKDGKFLHRFGPINQKKGYKLLNVIVTRAKYKVYVCTSIPEDVILNFKEYLTIENANNKRAVLFAYLAYAKAVSESDNEQRESILHSLDENSNSSIVIDNRSSDLESPFEEEVYNALANNFDKGKLIPQLQFAGFRIDIVYDPKTAGVPKIAIECDGAAYHSSKEAYLYDHHRQKNLEDHGFVFHRIWSTNWWRNPKRETKRLVDFIKSVDNLVFKSLVIDTKTPQAFTHEFVKIPINSPLTTKMPSDKDHHRQSHFQSVAVKTQIKNLPNKIWESAFCFWSQSELPGYKYAPNKNAWYKNKEVTRSEVLLKEPNGYQEIAEKVNVENALKVNVGNVVKVKYLNNGHILQFQLVDSELLKHEVTDEIQKINIRALVGVALRGKSVGDIVKVGNLDTFVEIIEIKN